MRSSRISAVAALCVLLAFANIMPTAASQQNMVTVPAGTNSMVRVLDTTAPSKAQQGTPLTAVPETNLAVTGPTIVPAGNTVYGRDGVAEQAGRATGSSNLQLWLNHMSVDGTPH